MARTVPVTPGYNIRQAMPPGEELSAAWLREYLRRHPTHDFRSEEKGGLAYFSAATATTQDLILEVRDPTSNRVICNVVFQHCDDGFQAVVY